MAGKTKAELVKEITRLTREIEAMAAEHNKRKPSVGMRILAVLGFGWTDWKSLYSWGDDLSYGCLRCQEPWGVRRKRRNWLIKKGQHRCVICGKVFRVGYDRG